MHKDYSKCGECRRRRSYIYRRPRGSFFHRYPMLSNGCRGPSEKQTVTQVSSEGWQMSFLTLYNHNKSVIYNHLKPHPRPSGGGQPHSARNAGPYSVCSTGANGGAIPNCTTHARYEMKCHLLAFL